MRNTNMFPFERNKYYYGKLLSVDDFNLEQNYYCNKLRAGNMLMNGMGVVAGLYVVDVDGQSISVETGCALDGFGREIIVDSPAKKKLSLLDGYEECISRGESYMYLCLEYKEEEKEPVHNVTGAYGRNDGMDAKEYNRIKESYHLYLTNQEPKNIGKNVSSYYEQSRHIYSKNGVVVTQVLPKYVKAGEKVTMHLYIEVPEKKTVSFSYELGLSGLTYEKKQSIQIQFNEQLYEKSQDYHLTYELSSANTSLEEATIAMKPETFVLVVNGKEKRVVTEFKTSICIVEEDIKDKVVESYYKSAMENILENQYDNHIYLAKIYFFHTEEHFQIERIINVPFGQYVMSNMLNATMFELLRKEWDAFKQKNGNLKQKDSNKLCEDSKPGFAVAKGTYEFVLEDKASKGQRIVSEELVHGLGLYEVSISVTLKTDRGELIYGDGGVFSDDVPSVMLAAKWNPETGGFVIGAKFLEEWKGERFLVNWCAVMDKERQVEEVLERKLLIRPGMLELYTRESRFLEVEFFQIDDQRIEWIVKDNEGVVDEENMYTAPNEKGVYEIVCRSIPYPDIQASVYAIVREPK